METVCYSTLATPAGPVTVCCSEKGLLRVELGRSGPRREARAKRFEWVESAEKTRQAVVQLREYFAGLRREFRLPLDLRGTEFQKKVWEALLQIPYGQTCSYGDIARKIGHPRAFRAVGMANHWNPIAIVVP